MNLVQSRKCLDKFFKTKSANDLWNRFFPARTPQGLKYWKERYSWLLFNRQPNARITYSNVKNSPMSEDDYSYLGSLVYKSDPFLEDKENKEFLVE